MSDKGTPFSYIKSKVGDSKYVLKRYEDAIDRLTYSLSIFHSYFCDSFLKNERSCDVCRTIYRARKLIVRGFYEK